MTRLTMQQLFHVGDDDSGCFLQKSWGDDDCDGDDGDGSDNSDDDGGDDDAVGVEKGVASCDKVTARSREKASHARGGGSRIVKHGW